MRKERPELEEQKDSLVINIAAGKKKLVELEDEILRCGLAPVVQTTTSCSYISLVCQAYFDLLGKKILRNKTYKLFSYSITKFLELLVQYQLYTDVTLQLL